MILKRTVLVDSRGSDRYQREIIVLMRESDRLLVNYELIRLGAAWVYSQYQNDKAWQTAQAKAKKARFGLWKTNRPIEPWKWRKR